jgi:hypothetical protein
MFRAIILPIFRSTRLCVTACGIMHPRCCRPATGRQHRGCIIRQAVTHSSAPEDGQNNCPKHDQWCTVKQISDNAIYLMIKYIKSVLRRVAKRLSYIEDARCLKVKLHVYVYVCMYVCMYVYIHFTSILFILFFIGFRFSSLNKQDAQSGSLDIL